MTKATKNLAVITGASRGLGYQVAKLLAVQNIHIIGIARTIGSLESLSDEISEAKGTSTMVPLNLENDTEIDQLATNIFSRWGKVDILIHVAAISSPMSPVASISLKDFDKSWIVNTRATIKLIQALDPLLKRSKIKKALFVDDLRTGKFMSSYASSKSATRNIIKNYEEESKRIGTKVISFKPLPMATALRARFHPGENRSRLSSTISQAERLIAKLDLGN